MNYRFSTSSPFSSYAVQYCRCCDWKLVLLLFFAATMLGQATEKTKSVFYNGKPHTITVAQSLDSSIATISIETTNTSIATLSVTVKEGVTDSVLAACKAKELMGHGKTVAGCLATAGTGVCLYTGLGGGAGAGYCVVAIEYAANGGAVDCVKGVAAEIAGLFGEKQSFQFFEDATLTPADVIERAIDKSCDTAKERWGK